MRIHHIALRTSDLERLVQFYSVVLGLPVRVRDDRRAWLALDGAVLMLERCEPTEPRVPAQTKELVAFAVEDVEREGWPVRLANAGVTVEARTDHTLYFRDPDGRRVAVSAYPL
jgi:catechol 2,3-dioxygenase-like lactoylglutathione lyase family enzyme